MRSNKIPCKCPHCGKAGRVPENAIGREIICPACKNGFLLRRNEEVKSGQLPIKIPTDKMKCPHCGRLIYKTSIICVHCNADLSATRPLAVQEDPYVSEMNIPVQKEVEPVFCRHCGTKTLDEEALFCGKCGTALSKIKGKKSDQNPLIKKRRPISSEASNIRTEFAFGMCHRCERDSYICCSKCGQNNRFNITKNDIRCVCGEIVTGYECPYCRAEIKENDISHTTDDEQLWQNAINHIPVPDIPSPTHSLEIVIIIGGIIVALLLIMPILYYGCMEPEGWRIKRKAKENENREKEWQKIRDEQRKQRFDENLRKLRAR